MISIHNIDVVVVMGDFGWVPVVARFVATAAGHFDRIIIMMMMIASLSYSFTTLVSRRTVRLSYR